MYYDWTPHTDCHVADLLTIPPINLAGLPGILIPAGSKLLSVYWWSQVIQSHLLLLLLFGSNNRLPQNNIVILEVTTYWTLKQSSDLKSTEQHQFKIFSPRYLTLEMTRNASTNVIDWSFPGVQFCKSLWCRYQGCSCPSMDITRHDRRTSFILLTQSLPNFSVDRPISYNGWIEVDCEDSTTKSVSWLT